MHCHSLQQMLVILGFVPHFLGIRHICQEFVKKKDFG